MIARNTTKTAAIHILVWSIPPERYRRTARRRRPITRRSTSAAASSQDQAHGAKPQNPAMTSQSYPISQDPSLLILGRRIAIIPYATIFLNIDPVSAVSIPFHGRSCS